MNSASEETQQRAGQHGTGESQPNQEQRQRDAKVPSTGPLSPAGGPIQSAGRLDQDTSLYDKAFTRQAPLSVRVMDAALNQQEGGRRLRRFAERLTPEIEETIDVLQEGIRLGVFSIDGRDTRY